MEIHDTEKEIAVKLPSKERRPVLVKASDLITDADNISPATRALLLAVRSGLIQIVGAIEDCLKLEKKRSVCARCRDRITAS